MNIRKSYTFSMINISFFSIYKSFSSNYKSFSYINDSFSNICKYCIYKYLWINPRKWLISTTKWFLKMELLILRNDFLISMYLYQCRLFINIRKSITNIRNDFLVFIDIFLCISFINIRKYLWLYRLNKLKMALCITRTDFFKERRRSWRFPRHTVSAWFCEHLHLYLITLASTCAIADFDWMRVASVVILIQWVNARYSHLINASNSASAWSTRSFMPIQNGGAHSWRPIVSVSSLFGGFSGHDCPGNPLALSGKSNTKSACPTGLF